jgi:hypothetical protein
MPDFTNSFFAKMYPIAENSKEYGILAVYRQTVCI